MHKHTSIILTLAVLIALLAGCGGETVRVGEPGTAVQTVPPTGQPEVKVDVHTIQMAQEYDKSGKFLDAALTYSRLAALSQPPEKQKFKLLATESLLRGNYVVQASQLLEEVDTTGLDIALVRHKQLLTAQVEIGKGKSKQALQILNQLTQQPTTTEENLKIHILQATAYQMSGHVVESVQERVLLDPMLTDLDNKKENQLAILRSLSGLTDNELQQLKSLPQSSALNGWMELAQITKSYQQHPAQLEHEINAWRQRHPDHTALNDVVDTLLFRQKGSIPLPKHIALLLPLEGKFSKAAEAVRDGFLASYFGNQGDASQPMLQIYDTGTDPANITNVYTKAINEGADFVVGPLDKSAATILADSSQLNAPTLSLNYVDKDVKTPANLFQFGLSPEDEASQVAERAWLDGYHRAVALIPEGQWGARVLNAFKTRWEELGGELAEDQTYSPQDNDFSLPIRRVLNIDDSEVRYATLKDVLKKRLVFNPRRRHDVDFVFIAAFPRQARLIRPQLKFHHADRLPVYATSHVFTGKVSAQLDRDMDGIYFGEMPWVLPGNAKQRPLRREIIKLWPESSENYLRLYGLGIDAYNLISNLNRLIAYRTEFYKGETGNIYLDDDNRLHRRLLWVGFQRGIPRVLDNLN